MEETFWTYENHFMDPPIELIYQGRDIENGEYIPIVLTQSEPQVEWDQQPGSRYTLIMYDYDAPNPPYLHWLVANISGRSGNTLVPYEPPNPPDGQVHTYTIEVFRQPQPIRRIVGNRSGFPVEDLIRRNGLQSIGTIQFQTSHQDDVRSDEFDGIGVRFPEEYNDNDPYFGHPEDFYRIN
jgi:phosphatidylethanolamine-binding protein (PEBP) family uncharacterized protein